MKKIIFSILFSITMLVVNGQGNLQFNQVKLITTVETVPLGKVWKVESATYGGGLVFCVAGTNGTNYCGNNVNNITNVAVLGVMTFTINGQPNYISALSYTNSFSPNLSPFPIWLPAGTTLSVGTNMRYLSIIEFNVVP